MTTPAPSPVASQEPVTWSATPDGVATVVLNRPDRNNAYDDTLIEADLSGASPYDTATTAKQVVAAIIDKLYIAQ